MLHHSIYPQINSNSHTSKDKHNSKLRQSVKFPSDIQIILRSDRKDYGNLFVSNIEAAENV